MRRESVDELLANINIDDFVTDYLSGSSIQILKKKYKIFSTKSLEHLIDSLISIGKIKKGMNIGKYVRHKNKDIIPAKPYNKADKPTFSEKESNTVHTNNALTGEDSETLHVGQDTNSQDTIEISKRIDQIGEEIDDILLGIDPIFSIQLEKKDKANRSRLDSVKEELTYLWNLGMPNNYICKKFNISQITLSSWKKKLGLPNKLPGSHLQRLEDRLAYLKMLEILSKNQGATYFSEIESNLSFSPRKIKRIITNYTNLSYVRLYLDLSPAAKWRTIDYFHSRTSDAIVFCDKRGLILRLSELLSSSPIRHAGGLDSSHFAIVISSLMSYNADHGVDFTSSDVSLLGSLIGTQSRQLELKDKIDLEQKAHKDKLQETRVSYETIKSLLAKFSESEITKKPVSITNKNFKVDGYHSPQLELQTRDAILHLLGIKGNKGMSIWSLTANIKETFPSAADLIKPQIKKLITEGEVVKFSTLNENGKKSIYLMLKENYDANLHSSQFEAKKKIFGHYIVPSRFIGDISKLKKGRLDSEENNQVSRLAGLFLVHHCSVQSPTEKFKSFCDFVATEHTRTLYVKVCIESRISIDMVCNFFNLLPYSSFGIIITFNEIDSSINEILSYLNRTRKNNSQIEVWTVDTVLRVVSEYSREPCEVGSIVKVMYGTHAGRYGKVVSSDFFNRSQLLRLAGDCDYTQLFFGCLQQVPNTHKVVSKFDAYSEFIKILKSNSSDMEFYAGLNLPSPFYKHDYNRIKTRQGIGRINNSVRMISMSFTVILNFDVKWSGFQLYDRDNYNDVPRDFCKNYVLSCECFNWLDQDDRTLKLCRHIVSALNEIWFKSENVFAYNEDLRKMRFFIYDLFIWHEFLNDIGQQEQGISDIMKEIFLLRINYKWKQVKLTRILDMLKTEKDLNSSFLFLETSEFGAPQLSRLSKLINDKELLHSFYSLTEKYYEVDQLFTRLESDNAKGLIASLNDIMKARSEINAT